MDDNAKLFQIRYQYLEKCINYATVKRSVLCCWVEEKHLINNYCGIDLIIMWLFHFSRWPSSRHVCLSHFLFKFPESLSDSYSKVHNYFGHIIKKTTSDIKKNVFNYFIQRSRSTWRLLHKLFHDKISYALVVQLAVQFRQTFLINPV